eukprot:2397712-Pyramimonas_sp.AAC.2
MMRRFFFQWQWQAWPSKHRCSEAGGCSEQPFAPGRPCEHWLADMKCNRIWRPAHRRLLCVRSGRLVSPLYHSPRRAEPHGPHALRTRNKVSSL